MIEIVEGIISGIASDFESVSGINFVSTPVVIAAIIGVIIFVTFYSAKR